MKKLMLCLTLALLPMLSFAAVEENKRINVLAIESNGNVFVAVNNPQASASCSWAVLAVGNMTGSNAEVVKAFYSTFLSAKIADESLTIEFNNCEVTKVTLD